jgi:hypothetical protein
MHLERFIEEAKSSSSGQQWWWRLILLFWFGLVFIHHLKDSNYGSLLGPLNLGIHEAGHLMFMPFGNEFLIVFGGTLAQVAAPVFGMWNFYVQKDFYSIALCFGWLSTNLFNISIYMADARARVLPLVSPFGPPEGHDWDYLFRKFGVLQLDWFFAGVTWFLAVIAMLICFFLCSLILKWMISSPKVNAK